MMKGNLLININFCIFALITDVGEKLKILLVMLKEYEEYPQWLIDVEERINME